MIWRIHKQRCPSRTIVAILVPVVLCLVLLLTACDSFYDLVITNYRNETVHFYLDYLGNRPSDTVTYGPAEVNPCTRLDGMMAYSSGERWRIRIVDASGAVIVTKSQTLQHPPNGLLKIAVDVPAIPGNDCPRGIVTPTPLATPKSLSNH